MDPLRQPLMMIPRVLACCLWVASALVVAGVMMAMQRAPQSADKPTEPTAYCTNATCHPNMLDRQFVHGPTANVECRTCHEYASAQRHLFQLTVPRSELCAGCHVLPHGTVVHVPVAEKNCTGCHDPHGSDHRMMLLKDPADGLCLLCHDRKLVDNTFVHGPVAVEACVLCHEPHSSGNPGLLTMAPGRLCFECHSEMEPKGAAARHLHKPMEDGCTSCHDPHSSETKYQLTATTPTLCFNCHQAVASELSSAGFTHQPANEEGGCAKCHNPHFTTLPRLQKLPQPDLCLGCHNQSMQTQDGRTIENMALLLEENPDHHGPIRDGGCTTCHHPHATDHQRLLSKDYPAEFYAPYSPERYELCFGCHLSDLVKDRSGTGLTRFRDGDLNLHWLHVNQEKGRTCRACHEVHASRRPFHIRESVPFGTGGWMLEINYTRTDDGGTCKPACHKMHEYARSSDRPTGANVAPVANTGSGG